MQGLRGWLIFALGVGLAGALGCQGQHSTAQGDWDAMKADNARLMEKNQALQDEADSMRTRMDTQPAVTNTPSTAPYTTPTTTPATSPTSSTPFFDIKSLQDRLPPGATVVVRHGEPAIVVEGSLMYSSGSTDITPKGKQVLDSVAGILTRTFPGHMVRVEGHTDADPIQKTKNLNKDNWDLASRRATEVVRYLVGKGVDPKRIYAGAFSMYQPVSTDKAKNRRVEIVVLPASESDSVPTVKTSKLD